MAVIVAASILFLMGSIVSSNRRFTYAMLAALTAITAFVYAARNGLDALGYFEFGVILWAIFEMIVGAIGWIGTQESPPE